MVGIQDSELGDGGQHAGRPAVVIGNGESRAGLDLELISPLAVTFGCNALYRDFSPDYLGSVDMNMTRELIKEGYWRAHKVVTPKNREREWIQHGSDKGERFDSLIVWSQTRGWSTGPMMVSFAAFCGCDPIYLLGFDMGHPSPHPRGGFNNIYKDTPFYRKSGDKPVHDTNWRKQTKQLLDQHSTRRFFQVGLQTVDDPRVLPATWEELLVLHTDDTSEPEPEPEAVGSESGRQS